MSAREGTGLGEFDVVVDHTRVWPVDWAVGLDEPTYQDPDVARASGAPDIAVPPGSLVFFAFLDDDAWLAEVGIAFDRSLATRRRLRLFAPVHVGDRLTGKPTITEVAERTGRDGSSMQMVTITTTYHRDGEPVMRELVTYATREAP